MCVYIYIYMYVYVHMFMCSNMYIYVYKYIYTNGIPLGSGFPAMCFFWVPGCVFFRAGKCAALGYVFCFRAKFFPERRDFYIFRAGISVVPVFLFFLYRDFCRARIYFFFVP